MEYTDEVLAIVCPKCRAARGGRCLVKTVPQGMQYTMEPHVERVEAAQGFVLKAEEVAA